MMIHAYSSSSFLMVHHAQMLFCQSMLDVTRFKGQDMQGAHLPNVSHAFGCESRNCPTGELQLHGCFTKAKRSNNFLVVW